MGLLLLGEPMDRVGIIGLYIFEQQHMPSLLNAELGIKFLFERVRSLLSQVRIQLHPLFLILNPQCHCLQLSGRRLHIPVDLFQGFFKDILCRVLRCEKQRCAGPFFHLIQGVVDRLDPLDMVKLGIGKVKKDKFSKPLRGLLAGC